MGIKSLGVCLSLLASVMTIITACVLSLLSEHVANNQLKDSIGNLLAHRSAQLADKIDRSMYERYHNIKLNAKILHDHDLLDQPVQVRTRLDDLRSSYEGFAWIGYAGLDGKVFASSNGLLEGVDVSQRPWFSQAAQAAFVGDLHHAVLLEKKLNENGMEPLRFLDVAMPVRAKNGAFAGVLGTHIDWRWIKSITQSLSIPGNSEIFIVASNATILLGPPGLQDEELPKKLMQKMMETKSGYLVERWKDGKTYLTGYTQSRGYRDYPGLNWLLLERQEIDLAYTPAKMLRQRIFMYGLSIAALFGVIAYFGAASISKPLKKITEAAEAIGHGEARATIPLLSAYHEVKILSHTLSNLVTRLVQREEQLAHQATHNLLTNLPNRTLLKALIDQVLLVAQEEKKKVAVVALGFNEFNTLQNTLGPDAGDSILLTVVERLKGVRLGASLGHLGKDEFLLVLPEQNEGWANVSLLVKRVQSAMEKPFLINEAAYFLTPSIGVSHYPDDGHNAIALLGACQSALSMARSQGGNRIEVYKSELSAHTLERFDLERELRAALNGKQLELHYQPQISLVDGTLVGVEALLRWRHPERGLISPAKFIPVAEASGLIIPIGNWVLNEACRQAKIWRNDEFLPFRVAVNVSSRQFTEGDILQQVSDALAMHKLDAKQLKIEITESLLMQDVDQSIATMNNLASLGVHIAIDDFGTGYSSLSYLGKFPIAELKIDQSFVRNIFTNASEAAIIKAIISLARNLELSVTAEGVETAEQCNFLHKSGCDIIQGYYFGKPLPPDQLASFLHAPTPNFYAKTKEVE